MSNDSRLYSSARLDFEPAPSALPAHFPTSARRTRHDDELAYHESDVAEPVAEGAGTEEDSW